MSERLTDRIVVVTGASRGIGLAVARRLAADGCRIVMLARGEAVLRERAAEVGKRALALPCDVSDPASVAGVAAAVRERLDTPDAIVNNAGLFLLATVTDTAPDDFAASLRVNVVAPFLLAREFVPDMRARGSGHLVTIGSIADHLAMPGNAAYSASKFGVRALHEVLREELRGTGVRATLVSPGPVDTPLWDELDPDNRAGFTPRSRMLDAGAVAEAVRYALAQPPDVNVDELRLSRS